MYREEELLEKEREKELNRLKFNRNIDSLFKKSPLSSIDRRKLNLKIKKLIHNDKVLGSHKLLNFNYFEVCHNFKKEMQQFDQKQQSMKKNVTFFNDENRRFNSVYKPKSFLFGNIQLDQMPKTSTQLVNSFIKKFEDKDYNIFTKNSLLLTDENDVNNFYKYNLDLNEQNDQSLFYTKKLDNLVNNNSALKNLEKALMRQNLNQSQKTMKFNNTVNKFGNFDNNNIKNEQFYKTHSKNLTQEIDNNNNFAIINTEINENINDNDNVNEMNDIDEEIEKEKKDIEKLNNLYLHINEDIEYFKTLNNFSNSGRNSQGKSKNKIKNKNNISENIRSKNKKNIQSQKQLLYSNTSQKNNFYNTNTNINFNGPKEISVLMAELKKNSDMKKFDKNTLILNLNPENNNINNKYSQNKKNSKKNNNNQLYTKTFSDPNLNVKNFNTKKPKLNKNFGGRGNISNGDKERGIKYFVTGDIKEKILGNDDLSKILPELPEIKEPNQVENIYNDIFFVKTMTNKFTNDHESRLKYIYSTQSDKYDKVFKHAKVENDRLKKLDKNLMSNLHNFD